MLCCYGIAGEKCRNRTASTPGLMEAVICAFNKIKSAQGATTELKGTARAVQALLYAINTKMLSIVYCLFKSQI